MLAEKKDVDSNFVAAPYTLYGNSAACETSAMLRGWREKIIFLTSDECVHTIYTHSCVFSFIFRRIFDIAMMASRMKDEGYTHRSHGKPMKGLRSSVWISWLISMRDIRIFRIYCLFDVSIVYARGFFSDADARAVMKILKFLVKRSKKTLPRSNFFLTMIEFEIQINSSPLFFAVLWASIFFSGRGWSAQRKAKSFFISTLLNSLSPLLLAALFFQFLLPCECWVCVKA